MDLNFINNSIFSLASAIQPDLKIFFEKVASDRKPISVLCRGKTDTLFRLSVVRASVLLALMLDFSRRRNGLNALHDIDSVIFDIASQLSEGDSDFNKEQIRVARYRLVKAWNTEFRNVIQLELDHSSFLLRSDDNLIRSLSIASSDRKIQEIVQNLTKETKLIKLKREGSLFIPAIPDAADEFLTEVYLHGSALKVNTAYARIANATLPKVVADKLLLSPTAKRLYDLINQRLNDGTLVFTEILNEAFFESLCKDPKSMGFQPEDALLLIKGLIRKIEFVPSYRLIVTAGEFSFMVGTYDGNDLDCAAFYKMTEQKGSYAYSCFAVSGEQIRKSVTDSFFSWIYEHPTTIQESHLVVGYLNEIAERITNLYSTI